MLKIIKVHSRSISKAFCFCISKPYVLAHCIPSAFQKHFSFPVLRVLNAECFSEAFQFFVLGGCCIPSLRMHTYIHTYTQTYIYIYIYTYNNIFYIYIYYMCVCVYFQLWLGNVWLIFQTLVWECIQGRCSWNADILRGGLLQCSWNVPAMLTISTNAPGMLRECCFSREIPRRCSGNALGNAPGNAPGMLLESWLSPGMLWECSWNPDSLCECSGNALLKCSRNAPGMLKKCSWSSFCRDMLLECCFAKIHRKCSGNAPGMLKKCSGNAKKMLRECSGNAVFQGNSKKMLGECSRECSGECSREC